MEKKQIIGKLSRKYGLSKERVGIVLTSLEAGVRQLEAKDWVVSSDSIDIASGVKIIIPSSDRANLIEGKTESRHIDVKLQMPAHVVRTKSPRNNFGKDIYKHRPTIILPLEITPSSNNIDYKQPRATFPQANRVGNTGSTGAGAKQK